MMGTQLPIAYLAPSSHSESIRARLLAALVQVTTSRKQLLRLMETELDRLQGDITELLNLQECQTIREDEMRRLTMVRTKFNVYPK